MPCESCSVQFTVFRRKRTCLECKRFYCSNCLTASKRNSQLFLCERCTVFTKRPLLRSDLLKLKPKDLIFYLQSKHISTTGCVEKDELIRLVLNHVDQADTTTNADNHFPSGSQQQFQQQQEKQKSPTDPTGKSFDSLRQTCQNFFFNITDNISDSLSAFDSKGNKPQQDNNDGNKNIPTGRRQRSNSATTTTTTHIYDQPRVSRREIPTYASSLNSGSTKPPARSTLNKNTTTTTIVINERSQSNQQPTTSTRTTNNMHSSQSSSEEQKTSTSSSLASPITMNSGSGSIASQLQAQEVGQIEEPQLNLNVPKVSDCECSDDELFANYTHTRNSLTTTTQVELTNSNVNQSEATTKTQSLKPAEGDEISHSSFEELGGGAVACGLSVVSDDSKCTEDSGGSSNTEAWQILEPQINLNENTAIKEQTPVIQNEPSISVPPRKKLLRRRSDRQRSSASDELNSPTHTIAADIATPVAMPIATTSAGSISAVENNSEELQQRRRSGTCRRCGKSNLRRYVEKMRQHLESAQMSEADIKREMNEFLAYLEDQTRSVDYSETETTASPLSNELNGVASNVQIMLSPTDSRNTPFFMDFLDENDGINVYGAEVSSYSHAHNPRFVNLNDYDDIKDLESLTVKKLKEVLMLHRVDYKGCCEKQELLERVERLWKTLKSAPAVHKLPTDELCKICMDAPIECVILECGHMATCTKCGKVLSECPICRQYIVRIVRFFRA